jgi:Tfp pilus assembly protein PilF
MYVPVVSREEAPPWDRRAGNAGVRVHLIALSLGLASLLASCDRGAPSQATMLVADEPSPPFRNVETPTAYVGDSACTSCHAAETSAYRQHAMSRSFHRWAAADRVESVLDSGIVHQPTGLAYSVVETDGQLFQVEYIPGPAGRRLHELRRRIDWVTGSGAIARTYFTEENGRLFQLPLTWYRRKGWDFSPGYQLNNARFDRSLPDRCVACHASYPEPLPFLEAKYARLRPGIGCERCHGPGALHVQERASSAPSDSGYDNTIVNPARLPVARRMDVCEQCHVHTTVSVLREGKNPFSFVPSQALSDHWAFFKVAGSIDIVSHADRLRQSACFLATQSTPTPLECATCHNPHEPPAEVERRNQPCQTCHTSDALQTPLARSSSLSEHAPSADCVSCHMPRTEERGVPHGSFTDHWIRVASRDAAAPNASRARGAPVEPYFARDRSGPEGEVYRGMGSVLYATLASDARALERAAGALDRALGADTTRGEALFLLGAAYEQLGRTAEAIRVLERSVGGDSTHPDRLRALAHAYRMDGRAPAGIEALYQRALALQPALAWIRAEYADLLQSTGQRNEAIAEYRKALAEQPSLSTAWFNLGTVLAEVERLEESSDAFARAVRLDPSLGEALSSLFQVRTTGRAVAGVTMLGSPLRSLPVRDRGPRAIRLTAAPEPGAVGVRIFNVPPRSLVRVLRGDGSLVRALPQTDGWSVTWDLESDGETPISGGLYRVQVQGRDPMGRPFAPQVVPFGIVVKSDN